MNGELISVNEAARILNVTPHYVRRLIHLGKLEGELIEGGTYHIKLGSLQRFMEGRINSGMKFGINNTQRGRPLPHASNMVGRNLTIKELIEKLEFYFKGDVISYVTIFGKNNSILIPDDGMHLDNLLSSMPVKFPGSNDKKYKKIILFLSSPGGLLEGSIKFIDIIKEYSETFEVIVPYMAKSAASLICLFADKIHMTTISELGPIDPIIENPTRPGNMIPAKAIDDFIKYYLSESNTGGALSNALLQIFEDKIDPYLLGSRKSALLYSQKEIRKALAGKIEDSKLDNAIKMFTTDDISHSHPITHKSLQEIGLNTIEQIKDGEKLGIVKMLFATYNEYMNGNNVAKVIGNRDTNINIFDPPIANK